MVLPGMSRGGVGVGGILQFVESVEFLGPVDFHVRDPGSRHRDIEMSVICVCFWRSHDGL